MYFKNNKNPLSVEISQENFSYLYELVLLNNTWYVQRAYIGDASSEIFQANYTDLNNMEFSSSYTTNRPTSIYTNILSGFLKNYYQNFKIVSEVFSFDEKAN